MRIRGCDFSFGVIPGHERALARALKRQGFRFVVRYLSTDSSKNLTKAEVHAYRREGLDIVTVWETTADAVLGGASAGHIDASAARLMLRDLGAPEHAPVHFAVDFDIQPAQLPALDAYLEAASKVLGQPLTGVYGGLEAVDAARHARYRWQTVAWSKGVWSPKDDLRQHLRTGVTGGVSWDADVAVAADYGQWSWPSKRIFIPLPRPVKSAGRHAKRVVQAEPVLAASGATALAGLAIPAWLPHLLHLSPTQLGAVLTGAVALLGLLAALATKPAGAGRVSAVSAGTAALATLATAVCLFDPAIHLSAALVGAQFPFVALVLGPLVRANVSPRWAQEIGQALPAPAAPAPAQPAA